MTLPRTHVIHHQNKAGRGEWIVKDGDDMYVMPDHVFTEHFEEVDDVGVVL